MKLSVPFLITLSLCGTLGVLQGQTVVVKDQLTRRPLELVNVAGYNSNQLVTTDVKGQANLSTFSAANDSIVFSQVGYVTKSFQFESITPGDVYTVYLDQSPFALDAVVISAARWKQKKRDIPVKIVSITPEDVQLQAPQTAADLLARTGEVYVQKSQLGGGSPMIRGFATNRVMLAVDGIRMNNAIFRGGNVQNVLSIDALSIEQSEVIYGPGSVIYGSDALGGVMSFYTLEPRLSTEDDVLIKGSAVLRTASANQERTGHFDINIGGERFASATSITYSDFEDLKMGSFGPDDYLRPEYAQELRGVDSVIANDDPRIQRPSGYQQLNLLQKFKFKASEHNELSYSFLYSTTSDYPRYDRLTHYQGNQLRSSEWYFGPQEWMMHALRMENDKRNWLYHRIRVTMAYQQFQESRHDRDFGADIRTNRVERVDAFSVNLDMEQDLGERHEIFYGAEFVTNAVDSRGRDLNVRTGQTFNAPSRYPNGATWQSTGVYLTDRFRWNEKLTVNTGVRFNLVNLFARIDSSFYSFPYDQIDLGMSAVNGSLGFAYRPTEKWQFNVTLSTGFRAPNIDDVAKVFDSEPGAVVIPNPDLGPEYAYNADLGITKVFGNRLKVDAVGFYTLLDRAMVRRAFTLEGQDSISYDGELSQVQAIQNASQATVYGIQAGFEWKVGGGFAVSSRINVQEGTESLSDGTRAPLRHAAPTFGLARLAYQRERLQLQLTSEFNAAVTADELPPSEISKTHIYALDEEGRPYSPAWYTFNFRAMVTLNDYLLLSGGIENILDRRFQSYSSGIAAPGRNFQASIRVSF